MKKVAFTLSEVMLVLSIIGVISAFTIPGLVTNIQDKVLVPQIKKDYSMVQQALKSYLADSESNMRELFQYGGNSADTLNKLSKYIAITKNCGHSTGCWDYDIKYNYPMNDGNGNFSSEAGSFGGSGYYATAILANGGRIAVNITGDATCSRTDSGYQKDAAGNFILDSNGNKIPTSWTFTRCGEIYFDVNGTTGPNQYGIDVFMLTVGPDKAYSAGNFWGSIDNVMKTGKVSYYNY